MRGGQGSLHSRTVSKADRRARKKANVASAREEQYVTWRRSRRRRWGARLVVIVVVIALAAGAASALFGDDDTASDTAQPTTTVPGPTTTAGPTTTTTLAADLAAIECDHEEPEAASGEKPQFEAPPEMTIDDSATYRATMSTSCGDIVVELDPSDPEQSDAGINNFVFLAREGFYDGTPIHRVYPTFVIQGGDPEGTGSGGPGYQFGSTDDTPKGLTYEVGDMVYANSGSQGTTGSQWFAIVGDEGLNLNQQPTFIKFGRVVEGLDVAQRIGHLWDPANEGQTQSPPTSPVWVVDVTIEEV